MTMSLFVLEASKVPKMAINPLSVRNSGRRTQTGTREDQRSSIEQQHHSHYELELPVSETQTQAMRDSTTKCAVPNRVSHHGPRRCTLRHTSSNMS